MNIKRVAGGLVSLIIIAGMGGGWMLWKRSAKIDEECMVLRKACERTDEDRKRLEKFEKEIPVLLDHRYGQCLNGMLDAAAALGVAVTVEKLPAGVQGGAWGLREARLRVVFGGITRRSLLLSVLAFIDRAQQEVPFVVEELVQEKEAVSVRLLVIGI